MKFHVIWALAIIASIGVIAHYTALSSMETDKQNAFMMKACADAGGSFAIGFAGRQTCKRPQSGGAE